MLNLVLSALVSVDFDSDIEEIVVQLFVWQLSGIRIILAMQLGLF